MSEQAKTPRFDKSFEGSPPEVYERYFVPVIAKPYGQDLVEMAELRPGERVLDVACGTGIVARLAAKAVGEDGHVTGVDANKGMIEVAESVAEGRSITWKTAPAETLPFDDGRFDVVFCQMSLQFFDEKAIALREMRRVLKPGGRLYLNVPGSPSEAFEILGSALGRHIDPSLEGFVGQVFALADPDHLAKLIESAGFQEVRTEAQSKSLSLPAPKQFLWQYINSTPLSKPVSEADDASRSSLEAEVTSKWSALANGSDWSIQQEIVVGLGRKAG